VPSEEIVNQLMPPYIAGTAGFPVGIGQIFHSFFNQS
jgi:hypothetical protein